MLILSCTHWSPGTDSPGLLPIEPNLQTCRSSQKCICIWIVVFSSARSKNWSSVPSLPVPGVSFHNWSLRRLFCSMAIAGWHYTEGLQRCWEEMGAKDMSVLVIQNELNLPIFQMSQGSRVCCCSSSWALHKLPETQDLFCPRSWKLFCFSCSSWPSPLISQLNE